MNDNRMGGLALIIASVANIIVMALHPNGHDLYHAGDRFNLVARLAVGVHWMALLSMVLSFLGALALTRYLDSPNRLAVAGQVFFGLSLVAGMLAVVFSGFMGTGLARKIVAEAPPGKEYWEMISGYNFGLNQAFARVLAVTSALAISLWSAAMMTGNRLSRGIAIFGVLIGFAIVVMVGPGFLVLDVHGFGLVVLLQSAWFIGVGMHLRQCEIERKQSTLQDKV